MKRSITNITEDAWSDRLALRSAGVREVLQQENDFSDKWGMPIVLGIVASVITAASLISYSDKINIDATVSFPGGSNDTLHSYPANTTGQAGIADKNNTYPWPYGHDGLLVFNFGTGNTAPATDQKIRISFPAFPESRFGTIELPVNDSDFRKGMLIYPWQQSHKVMTSSGQTVYLQAGQQATLSFEGKQRSILSRVIRLLKIKRPPG